MGMSSKRADRRATAKRVAIPTHHDDGWGGLVKPVADAILRSFDWDKDGTGMGNLVFAACHDAGFEDYILVSQGFANHAACAVLATLVDHLDLRAAQAALADFEKNGGVSLQELKRGLGNA